LADHGLAADCSGAQAVNGMSVDVEEYFQVWAFAQAVDPADWDGFPSRIEKSIDIILRRFDEAGVKATFFVLGWIAERHASMIRSIVDAGHEIASHGYAHAKVSSQSMQEFREDVTRAKAILEDLSGHVVKGYRAPSFSIGSNNMEALDVLVDTGHQYSSSIYPISHDHYGMPEAPRFSFRTKDSGILEIPMSTVSLFGRNLPCGGGGYFRFAPYRYFRWAIRRLNESERKSAVFYFHPWELDHEQPRMKNISSKARFRHYFNLGRMEQDLQRLLGDFRWDRMDRLFLDER
jgi:polysaccharide deacetylase family protein (PEP-CTERM system associated)